jgi:hypothetical protein
VSSLAVHFGTERDRAVLPRCSRAKAKPPLEVVHSSGDMNLVPKKRNCP